ncbi:dynamin family protein [Nocardia anaemiae]|uniref:dynamin family protein n=1 Tax=Nocardia anaemiae TaxID=263910 RepID=UPI0007A3F522|nr:dynamin family protein [Nocardia anaemiae]
MNTAAPIARVDRIIEQARRVYFGNRAATDPLEEGARRLHEPLRIALAGAVKAGKSTLLNALVGQDIAPTDATECTRVVTWYRHGATPTVIARLANRRSEYVPIQRAEGGLTFDLGKLMAAQVDRIDVDWPVPRLARTTIIDTPGTTSLSRDVSARTLRLLTPDTGSAGADAVVYLFRSLDDSDLALIRQIGEHVGGNAGPLGIIGVLSRADELGAGHPDAMHSARAAAKEFTRELEMTGLCQAAVPVAGLLAFTAKTLRQSEFVALRQLAAVAPADLELAMLSADRFQRADYLPIDGATRQHLVSRLGLFGINMALTRLRAGTSASAALVDELIARSGIGELERVIDIQFGQRADELKAHTALLMLRQIFDANRGSRAAPLRGEVETLLANVHGFEELRLLSRLRSSETALSEHELADLQRVIGGRGTGPAERLGIEPFAVAGVGQDVALAEIRRWRSRAEHPLADQFTANACIVAARSAEGVLSELRRGIR